MDDLQVMEVDNIV
jgi:hypothetical protein